LNILLLFTGKKSNKFVLPAGNYSYPFQFQLPPNLPSSFEGYYGHVRYWVRGTIDKPWNFDHMTKTPFTVVSALDLNSLPEANVSYMILKYITKEAKLDYINI